MCEDSDIWEKSFRQKKWVEREGREPHEDQLIEVNWYGSTPFNSIADANGGCKIIPQKRHYCLNCGSTVGNNFES